MSHPIPTHDYSEETYKSDSPHKDVMGKKSKKAKARMKAIKKMKK